jgi:hypothetical protein
MTPHRQKDIEVCESAKHDPRLIGWTGRLRKFEKTGLRHLPVFKSVYDTLRDELLICAQLEEPARTQHIEVVREQIKKTTTSHLIQWGVETSIVHGVMWAFGFSVIPMAIALAFIAIRWSVK